jgi:hypothetical protein
MEIIKTKIKILRIFVLMNEKIRHIASMAVLAIFLVYCVGVEVSVHTCTQHKTKITSLFDKAECPCHHHHHHNGCCHENNGDSCADPECGHTVKLKENCCMETTTVFAINDSFQSNGKVEVKYSPVIESVIPILVFSPKTITIDRNINNLARDEIVSESSGIIRHINSFNLSKSGDEPASIIA